MSLCSNEVLYKVLHIATSKWRIKQRQQLSFKGRELFDC